MSYISDYTGAEIDESIKKYFDIKADGGYVSVNGLATILGNYSTSTQNANTYLSKTDAASTYLSKTDAASTYLTSSNAASTYLPLSGGTLSGNLYINSTNAEQVIELQKNGVKRNQLDASTNQYILWSNTAEGSSSTNWVQSYAINRATNVMTIYGRLDTRQPEFSIVDDAYIQTNCAAYVTTASSVTGTLKITLPLPNGYTVMQMLEVWVYDYSSMAGSQLIISGYTYSNKTWYNYACKTQGNYSRGCRMAFDGSNYCILLGTTSTSWSYPQIFVAKWFGGFTSRSAVHRGNITVSFITSESGYTITGSAT